MPMQWKKGNVLFEFYKKAINIRNQHCALRHGQFRLISAERNSKLYAFIRKIKDESIYIAINMGTEESVPKIFEGKNILWQKNVRKNRLQENGFIVAIE